MECSSSGATSYFLGKPRDPSWKECPEGGVFASPRIILRFLCIFKMHAIRTLAIVSSPMEAMLIGNGRQLPDTSRLSHEGRSCPACVPCRIDVESRAKCMIAQGLAAAPHKPGDIRSSPGQHKMEKTCIFPGFEETHYLLYDFFAEIDDAVIHFDNVVQLPSVGRSRNPGFMPFSRPRASRG